VIADTTRRLAGDVAARAVPPLVTLFPGLVLWTSQLLREAGVLLLIALAANAAARLSIRYAPSRVFVLGGVVAMLFSFRASTAALLGVALVPALIVGRRNPFAGVGTSVSVSGLAALALFSLGVGLAGFQLIRHAELGDIDTVRRDSSVSAASGFAEEADVSTPQRAISYLPIGLPAFLLGPAPWTLASSRQLPALPDVILWWSLLPSVLRGGRRLARQSGAGRVLLLALPAFVVSSGLCLLIANYGTIVRERMQVVVLVIPLIALGWVSRPPRAAAHPPRRRTELVHR
jgi:hypothetical protein